MDKACANCGTTDDVTFYKPLNEHLCDMCQEACEDEVNGERIANE